VLLPKKKDERWGKKKKTQERGKGGIQKQGEGKNKQESLHTKAITGKTLGAKGKEIVGCGRGT